MKILACIGAALLALGGAAWAWSGHVATNAAARRSIPVYVTVFASDAATVDSADVQRRVQRAAAMVWRGEGITMSVPTPRVVKDADLAGTLVTSREMLDPCRRSRLATLRARDHRPGIHLYVGGNIETLQADRGALAGTCGPFEACQASVGHSAMIALSEAGLHDTPEVLSHELGHLFGLAHTDVDSACGSRLLPRPTGSSDLEFAARARTSYLMRPRIDGAPGKVVERFRLRLSRQQISRAVTVVCASADELGAVPDRCQHGGG